MHQQLLVRGKRAVSQEEHDMSKYPPGRRRENDRQNDSDMTIALYWKKCLYFDWQVETHNCAIQQAQFAPISVELEVALGLWLHGRGVGAELCEEGGPVSPQHLDCGLEQLNRNRKKKKKIKTKIIMMEEWNMNPVWWLFVHSCLFVPSLRHSSGQVSSLAYSLPRLLYQASHLFSYCQYSLWLTPSGLSICE